MHEPASVRVSTELFLSIVRSQSSFPWRMKPHLVWLFHIIDCEKRNVSLVSSVPCIELPPLRVSAFDFFFEQCPVHSKLATV